MKKENQHEADVVIIGGGIAGITTALELLESNKKIILLDRDTHEKFGGQAITAFGGMALVGTPIQKLAGIKDSPELAYEDWCQTARFGKDDIYPKKWAELYCHQCNEEVYKWLRKRGVLFLPSVLWPERGYNRPGNSLPRYHIVWGTGSHLTKKLIDELETHKNRKNLTLIFEHIVDSLHFKNSSVNGCEGRIEANGERFTVRAGKVVIANGGLGGNIELVKKIWPEFMGNAPSELLVGSHPYCDGSGHEMARKVDGAVTNTEYMWNYPGGIAHTNPQFTGQGLSVLPPKSALWMDYSGRRIGPQPLIGYYDTSYTLAQVCKFDKPYTWHILNWKIAVKELALSGAEHNITMRDRKYFALMKMVLTGNKDLVKQMIEESTDFVTAFSLEELAEKMNQLTGTNDVDVKGLEYDIRRYDDQIDRGVKYHNDDQLRRIAHARNWFGDKIRTCKFQKILDAKSLPLIAIRYRVLTRKSLGGIKTDLESRVLNTSGGIINGLYAVGEAAGFGGGGINGKSSLEGTFISTSILTARKAARAILAQ